MSTIAAVATPPGSGLRGVIRVSGPAAAELARATLVPAPDLARRGAFRARFDDGRGTQPVLLFWMPAPHSYTREDVAEFHLPGSPPLVDAALTRLFALGAVPAAPGEFTRRAFEHGRIDLTRAEGVLALVEAENERAARAAAELCFGGLAERVAELRLALEDVRALCEASLDFDEADTGHVPDATLLALGRAAAEHLARALAIEERREPLAGLPRLALVGAPNAGKSSLFNHLTGAHALVSALPGTTRDGVAGVWRLSGVDCRLLDTPGLDEALSGEAEARAQELARELVRGADLELFVADAATTAVEELPLLAARLPPGRRLLVWNKVDLARPPVGLGPARAAGAEGSVGVSAASGEGLDELARRAAELLGLADPEPGDRPPGQDRQGGGGLGRELSLRHRHALLVASAHFERALAELAAGGPLDLVAQGLRGATDALDEISGRTTPEDVLDRIFARFCLGK